ncbi:junctional adhesion molecule-like [Suncus etruscus]|uniref:junctional adhesion molecule-like n=1 Tax=Suncus etruscus TaxID=109475 RepID=UPI002110714B|nr:junctional adhesion molecule-like [Suncus etruscus]
MVATPGTLNSVVKTSDKSWPDFLWAFTMLAQDNFLGLSYWVAASLELTVHVGDSVLIGCFCQSTKEKPVIKVDWIFSSGQQTQDEFVLYYYSNLSVPLGRFQNRVQLVGNVSGGDGSLLLQDVQEADQGNFTCEIRRALESRVWKKRMLLQVLPAEPEELSVQVGDSIQMGCAFHSTEESPAIEVEWRFSSEEQAQEEVIQRSIPGRHPQILLGAASPTEGTTMLHGVTESDGGRYTCLVYLGGQVLRKIRVLHVTPLSTTTLLTPSTQKHEFLGGNHLVMLVGIICATIILLPVLLLLVVRCRRLDSVATSTKSLENTQKALPEKHVYSAIGTREVTVENETSEKSEATYMTMHPVWPQRPVEPNHSPSWRAPEGLPRAKWTH